jgi:hypothetical protein
VDDKYNHRRFSPLSRYPRSRYPTIRYQATLGTRRSLGREFLAEEKRKRGKERRREKEEKRGEKRVEVWKRIRVTSVFSQ